MYLRIQPHLIEHRWITKGAEEFARKNRGKINALLGAVMKPQVQGEGGDYLDGLHAADAMAQGWLRKWFDGDWGSPLLQPFATFGGGITRTGVTLPAATANFGFNRSQVQSLQKMVLRAQQASGDSTVRASKVLRLTGAWR